MTTGDNKTSLRANLVSSVVAAAFATLITGLAGWVIDAEVTAFFLALYGTFMTVFFFAMGLWRQRRSVR